MSEPMSNGEIEDVLSSIRRLVSENATRASSGAPAGTQGADKVAPVEALVLTEALRIEPTEEGGGTEGAPVAPPAEEGRTVDEGDAAPQGAGPHESPNDPPRAPRSRPSEEAGESGAAPEQQSDAGDEQTLDASWRRMVDPDTRLWEAAENFAAREEPRDDPESGPGASSEDPLQSRVQGFEAAFTGREFEPDGSEVKPGETSYDWDTEGGEDEVIDLSTPEVPSGQLLFMRSGEAADRAAGKADDQGDEAEASQAEARGGETGAGPDAEEEAQAEETWPEPEEDWTAPDLPRPEADEAPGADGNDAGDAQSEEIARAAARAEAVVEEATQGALLAGVSDVSAWPPAYRPAETRETPEQLPPGQDAPEAESGGEAAEDAVTHAQEEATPEEADGAAEAQEVAAQEASAEHLEDTSDAGMPDEPSVEEDGEPGSAFGQPIFRARHRDLDEGTQGGAAEAPDREEEQADAAAHFDEPEDEANQDDAEAAEELEGFAVGTEDRPEPGRLHLSSAEGEDPWREEAEADEHFDESALAAALDAPEPPALIDEARLVELVSEVVRQELRGRMGERITQNVRKLVRREIARALETRGIR